MWCVGSSLFLVVVGEVEVEEREAGRQAGGERWSRRRWREREEGGRREENGTGTCCLVG